MKLALGTVQFGGHYGINNKFGIPSDEEITSILKFSFENGIRILDTAPIYGNAEEKIGNLTSEMFKIVSKFSRLNSVSDLPKRLNSTLLNLKSESIFGYLSHNADELIGNVSLWDELLFQKSLGKIEKIGFSLYSINQLEKCLELGLIPDIVQLPYSLLDRKFESYFETLNSYSVEIHVRSVYLQGLYFMDICQLPLNLQPIKPHLLKIREICFDENLTLNQLALNFVLHNKNISNVIVGVENNGQLQENINSQLLELNKDVFEEINKIIVQNQKLLNPSNW
jgi:aryl-alcohol dehydrogenase-like predicted oxidoreductase